MRLKVERLKVRGRSQTAERTKLDSTPKFIFTTSELVASLLWMALTKLMFTAGKRWIRWGELVAGRGAIGEMANDKGGGQLSQMVVLTLQIL